MIAKLQYARIFNNLNRRNKLWSSGKFDNDNLDDKADYSYLCGGSENMPRDKLNRELNQSDFICFYNRDKRK